MTCEGAAHDGGGDDGEGELVGHEDCLWDEHVAVDVGGSAQVHALGAHAILGKLVAAVGGPEEPEAGGAADDG